MNRPQFFTGILALALALAGLVPQTVFAASPAATTCQAGFQQKFGTLAPSSLAEARTCDSTLPARPSAAQSAIIPLTGLDPADACQAAFRQKFGTLAPPSLAAAQAC